MYDSDFSLSLGLIAEKESEVPGKKERPEKRYFQLKHSIQGVFLFVQKLRFQFLRNL